MTATLQRIVCEGCSAPLNSPAEVFGGIGQCFCADCWYEEMELEVRRELLMPERKRIEQQIFNCHIDRQEAIELGNGGDKQRMEAIIESAYERLGDIDEELACLTVAYQRKYSVIGRAA
jgi:hypothetical protein